MCKLRKENFFRKKKTMKIRSFELNNRVANRIEKNFRSAIKFSPPLAAQKALIIPATAVLLHPLVWSIASESAAESELNNLLLPGYAHCGTLL